MVKIHVLPLISWQQITVKSDLPFISLSDPDDTELSCVLTKTGCSASVIISSNSFFLSFYQILYKDVFGQACSESLGDFIDQYMQNPFVHYEHPI